MQTNWWKDWTMLLSITVFVLTILLALATPHGIIPAHLQTGGQGRSIHWIVVAYIKLIAPIFYLSVFTTLILFVAQIIRSQSDHRTTTTLAVWLSLLAIVLAGYSSLSLFAIGYEPLNGIETPDSKYHLGMRTAMDGDYFWIISKCDRWNFACEYRGITNVITAEKSQPGNTRLEYDKNTGVLLIRTTERVIPVDSFGKI